MPAGGPPRVPVLPCPSPAGPDHPSLVSSLHASSIPQSTNPPGPRSTRRPQCRCSPLSPLPALTTRVAGVTRSHVGVTPNDSESRVRSVGATVLRGPGPRALPSRLFLPLLPFSSVTFPTQESQPQSVLSLGTLTSTAAALKASGLFLLCLPVTGSGPCSAPGTRGSLPPQREALCQEHFLSGSDLLLLAAAEAGSGGHSLVGAGAGGGRRK